MITDDGAPIFRPWPSGAFPEGGTSLAWDETGYRDVLLADWESWPPELSTALLTRESQPYGFPRAWAGPKAEIVRHSYVGGRSGGISWGGLFMGGLDMLLVANLPTSLAATTFAHEWGHFVDWSYRQRVLKLGRSNLSNDAEFRQLWLDVRAANPGSTSHYHSAVTEFFAQTFAGWAKRMRSVIEDTRVCGPGEFTERLLDIFARLIPYEGMEVMLEPVQLRAGRLALAAEPEPVACGGVVV